MSHGSLERGTGSARGSGRRLIAVVAVAENGVIGNAGQLPWHLPADLAWFKRQTLGKPVLMGRRTWESIGKPLPGRLNVVLTRGPVPSGCVGAATLDEALALPGVAEALEVMIIGGASVYAAALERCDELLITRIHASVQGDTFFAFDVSDWERVSAEPHEADEKNPHPYTFERWIRKHDQTHG